MYHKNKKNSFDSLGAYCKHLILVIVNIEPNCLRKQFQINNKSACKTWQKYSFKRLSTLDYL